MNKILLLSLFVLIVVSVFTVLLRPEAQEKYPQLEWMSDTNPQRFEQAELFETWLKTKYPDLSKDSRYPAFGIKLNAANNQSTVIQAVSGVAGDLIDHLNGFRRDGTAQTAGRGCEKTGI